MAGEGQELNLLHEEGTGARESLPGTCTLFVPKQVQLPSANLFLLALTLPFPHCWAEAPLLGTAGPEGPGGGCDGEALEPTPQG